VARYLFSSVRGDWDHHRKVTMKSNLLRLAASAYVALNAHFGVTHVHASSLRSAIPCGETGLVRASLETIAAGRRLFPVDRERRVRDPDFHRAKRIRVARE
jgi:hypothetical protein